MDVIKLEGLFKSLLEIAKFFTAALLLLTSLFSGVFLRIVFIHELCLGGTIIFPLS